MSMQYKRSPFAGSSPLSTSVEEELLAEAEVRLCQAKLDAILGRRYDAEEFDAIVAAYRSAKRAADEARMAVLLSSAAQGKTAAVPPQRSFGISAARLAA